MDCDFKEKVSMLMDGELGPRESEEVRNHVAGCRACQQAQADFAHLREQIQSYDFTPDSAARKRALSKVLGPESASGWGRTIALPVPVFAAILICVIALGLWSASMRLKLGSAGPQGPGARRVIDNSAAARPPEGGMDLSRFDRGERAVIYKVPRAETTRGEGSR
jgi:anti-sigma factor RsiW